MPVSLTMDAMWEHILRQRNGYWVTWKADGFRCFVCAIPDLGVFLINRTNEIARVVGAVCGPRRTVLDAELVTTKDGSGQVCYVFDGIYGRGKSLRELNLPLRLGAAKDAMVEIVGLPFPLVLKDYAHLSHIEKLVVPPEMSSDGLVFAPTNRLYRPFTDCYTLKWKPPAQNTVDFRVNVVALPPDDEGNPGPRKWSVKFLSASNQVHQQLYVVGNARPAEDGQIYETRWTPARQLWCILKRRPDKTKANANPTIRAAMTAIDENVTYDRLVDIVMGRTEEGRKDLF